MTETDKLLVRIGTARDAISRKTEQTSLDYMIDGVLMNCSVLLKEQETQKFFVDESGKITPLPVVVRCKDCIHWDIGHTEGCDNSDSVCFHNGWCKPDWFCADGERKEGR